MKNDYLLAWGDIVYDLQDLLADHDQPVYLVGGVVRDALLRRPLKDVDITVARGGIKLARRIANGLHGDFFPLDADRDVGRALIPTPTGRLTVDVAGFRGESLEADLRDRDFTFNALAVDLRGDLHDIIDPTGGVDDALEKTIRRCNPESIARDPIRALRAVRQSVQFGCRIEPDTLADVRRFAPHVLDTSIERVRDELFRLLMLDKPAAALRIADRVGLLPHILPELVPLHDLRQHRDHQHDAWNHTLAVVESLADLLTVIDPQRTDNTTARFNLGMVAVALDGYRRQLHAHFTQIGADDRTRRGALLLAALLHDVGKAVVPPASDAEGEPLFAGHEQASAQIAIERTAALHLSSAEQDCIVKLVRYHMGSALWLPELMPVDVYRYWKRMGDAGIELIFLTLADYLGAVGFNFNQDVWLVLIDHAQTLLRAYYDQRDRYIDLPVLVDGRVLMQELGVKPGPRVGELLELIREAQVSGTISSPDEALALARSLP